MDSTKPYPAAEPVVTSVHATKALKEAVSLVKKHQCLGF